MTPESVTDLKSLVFVVGSLLSVATVVRCKPSECRLVAEAALPVGLAGFLIGVISMLAAESNPSQIAPAVAIAILTLVYAGIMRLLFVLNFGEFCSRFQDSLFSYEMQRFLLYLEALKGFPIRSTSDLSGWI